MPLRDEYEGDLFRRYEARIVALEIGLRDLAATVAADSKIVSELRDAKLLADAIAERLNEGRRWTVTKLQVAVAIAALVVPPTLGALVAYAILHYAGAH